MKAVTAVPVDVERDVAQGAIRPGMYAELTSTSKTMLALATVVGADRRPRLVGNVDPRPVRLCVGHRGDHLAGGSLRGEPLARARGRAARRSIR